MNQVLRGQGRGYQTGTNLSGSRVNSNQLEPLEQAKNQPGLRIRSEEEGSLVLPAPVASEVDYLLGARFGEAARRAFLSDLAARRYDVACLDAGDYGAVAELDARYADLGLGLADCSVVVLAERYETRRLLTFDERHF